MSKPTPLNPHSGEGGAAAASPTAAAATATASAAAVAASAAATAAASAAAAVGVAARQGQPLIRLRGLTKTYGHGAAAFQALRGIDLDIHQGEFVAIMGHSGSGKSTLMNLLGCLDTPTTGSYLYQGIAIESLDADQRSLLRRHALGFIFQGFNLLARTSALENVELPLLYRGSSRSERERLATAALRAVGLPDKLRNTPAELSGGQQQRVAIARAIVTNPSTLFADEPTGNLDSRTTQEIIELLIRLNEQLGITILMVTHEDEVAAHARRVVSIRDGLIEWDRQNEPRPPAPLPQVPPPSPSSPTVG